MTNAHLDKNSIQIDAYGRPGIAGVDANGDLQNIVASSLAAATDTVVPAANTAAVITLAATAGVSHVVTGVAVSYSAAPTGGRLTITDGGVTVWDTDITASGILIISFPRPRKFGSGNAVVITLAAAGAAVVGKVNLLNHWTE